MAVLIGRDRIALGSFQYARYSLQFFLETVKELGMTAIDLWCAAPHLPIEVASAKEVEETASLVKRFGLKTICLTPEQLDCPWNIAAGHTELRRKSIERTKRAIDAANVFESSYVLTTSGRGCYDLPKEDAWNASRESLSELAEYAKKKGVRLLLETLTPPSSNVINTPAQQREMISFLPKDSTGSVMDIGQMDYMGQDLSEYLSKEHLPAHVHLHDSRPAVHMALGEGSRPVAEILERIEHAGYTGMYSIETNDARYRMDPKASDVQNVKWLCENGFIEPAA